MDNQKLVEIENKIEKLENIFWRDLQFLQDDDFKVSSEEEYAKVAASLLRKNFIAPFYVWEKEGVLYCLDGKRRDTVLRRIAEDGGVLLGDDFHPCNVPDKLPAIFVKAETKQEAATYVLAYSSAYGEVTQDGLKKFVEKFSIDFKDELSQINFQDFSMERFLQKNDIYGTSNAGDDLSVEGVEELIPATILVVRGDMFRLGNATLLCGDSTLAESFETLLGGEKIRMVYTDPPYNIPNSLMGEGIDARHDDFAMAAGEMSDTEFVEFLRKPMTHAVKHSHDGALHYYFMDFRHVWHMCEAAREPYGSVQPKQLCVWNKSAMGNGAFYRAKHEDCFIFKHGKGKHTSHLEMQDRIRTNVWDYASANSFSCTDRDRVNNIPSGIGMLGEHPTPKPVEMAADAILDVTNEGDVVLDCFAGSGSTMIACLRTGRKFYGIEYEPKYMQLIINRYLKYCQDNSLDANFVHLNGNLTQEDFANGK